MTDPSTTPRPDLDLDELVVYSPAAVAQHAGCATQTVYRHLDDDLDPKKVEKNGGKRFPNAFRIGAKWMIPEEDMIAFLGYDPSKVKVRLVK